MQPYLRKSPVAQQRTVGKRAKRASDCELDIIGFDPQQSIRELKRSARASKGSILARRKPPRILYREELASQCIRKIAWYL